MSAIDIQEEFLPRGCRVIDFPPSSDERGNLSAAEHGKQIPFAIERVFWIYDIPAATERGSHSHNESAEVLVALHGAFDLLLDDGHRTATLHLDSASRGVLVAPGVWSTLKNFLPGSVCMVLASHPYNASGYINDYATYRNELVSVVPYTPDKQEEWDTFVEASKNGTFLFKRGYMDYHALRFTDCSLLFYKENRLIALLPANIVEEEHTVYSHGGLTYGGLILSDKATAVEALEVFSCALDYMRTTLHATRLLYKPVPHIYARTPSEEDLYALFRLGGVLKARTLSSAVYRDNLLPMRTLRRRGVAKAQKEGVVYEESRDLSLFWPLLTEVLQEKHHRAPVHTLQEMQLLMQRFPANIHLFLARLQGEVLAGSVVYESPRVAHAQYIAAGPRGRALGALDGLFSYLIEERFAGKGYFDFGISTEEEGRVLNEGLLFQKEGFGARSVVYDTYEVQL